MITWNLYFGRILSIEVTIGVFNMSTIISIRVTLHISQVNN